MLHTESLTRTWERRISLIASRLAGTKLCHVRPWGDEGRGNSFNQTKRRALFYGKDIWQAGESGFRRKTT